MLASKFLNKKMKKNIIVLKFEKIFNSFSNFYADTLNYWINRKKTIIVFILFVIVSSSLLYNFATKELMPKEDRGVYLVIGFTDEGSSFEYTKKRAEDVEKRLIPLLQNSEESYQKIIMRVPGFGRASKSYNSFIIIALLDEWKNRKKDAKTIMREAIGKAIVCGTVTIFPIALLIIVIASSFLFFHSSRRAIIIKLL